MRESNYRVIGSNKSCILITSTVYDRRALDSTCDRPLVNSLNHLTYLTSTSSKVRESLCNDGGLERLIAILKECMKPQKSHLYPGPKTIKEEKEDTLVAWKWTLAFQCLVLIGTRGSEQIRRRVVEAGLIPVLATVLDNYLLINRNLDGIRDCSLDTTLLESLVELVKENEYNNGREDQIRRLGGEMDNTDISTLLEVKPELRCFFESKDRKLPVASKWKFQEEEADYTEDEEEDYEENEKEDEEVYDEEPEALNRDEIAEANLLEERDSEASEDNQGVRGAHGRSRLSFKSRKPKETKEVNSFIINTRTVQKNLHDINNQVSAPRLFFNGTLIPKDDDVVWSLQLLAFISKYSSLKAHLQHTTIINALSLRYLLRCSSQAYEEASKEESTATITESLSSARLKNTTLQDTSPVSPLTEPPSSSISRVETSGLVFTDAESPYITPVTSAIHSSSSNYKNITGNWKDYPSLRQNSSSLIDDEELSQSYSSQIEPLTQTQSILSQDNSSDERVEITTTTHNSSDFEFPNPSAGVARNLQSLDKDADLVMGASEDMMNDQPTIPNFAVEDQQFSSPESGSIMDQEMTYSGSNGKPTAFEETMKDVEFEERKTNVESKCFRGLKSLEEPRRTRSSCDLMFFPKNIRNAIRNLEKCCNSTISSLNNLRPEGGMCFVNLICKLNEYYTHKEVSDKTEISKNYKQERKDYLSKWNYKTYFYQKNVNELDIDQSISEKLHLNIFPMVEKFTPKTSNTSDMCYWSGVIMRNSCRKDEARGGVRQCANFKCGKWEDSPRQFAKCRRCKRTKYCSKQCQLQAWGFHKYWCVDSCSSSTSSGSTNTHGVNSSSQNSSQESQRSQQQQQQPQVHQNAQVPAQQLTEAQRIHRDRDLATATLMNQSMADGTLAQMDAVTRAARRVFNGDPLEHAFEEEPLAMEALNNVRAIVQEQQAAQRVQPTEQIPRREGTGLIIQGEEFPLNIEQEWV